MTKPSMHIPPHFYEEVPTSEGVDYSMTPTGVLSVSKLLAGQAYWKKPWVGTTKKPKTLIINGCSSFGTTTLVHS